MTNKTGYFKGKPLICLIIIFALSISLNSYASDKGEEENSSAMDSPNYTLTVKNNQISLKAQNASLKKIIEQLGRELNIQTDARISADDKISIEFTNLPLKEAVKQLSKDYAFITDKQGKAIQKIVLYPKGQKAVQIESTSQAGDQQVTQNQSTPKSGSKPFKFEFDPRELMNKQEAYDNGNH
jgi:hypothetical protein